MLIICEGEFVLERCNSLGHLLNKASHLMKWELTNQLKDYDLTAAQWAVLKFIYRQDCCQKTEYIVTPAAIAETIRVERPAITRILDKLLQGEWIEKRENPTDRRSQIIALTPKAKSLMPQFTSIGDGVVDQSISGLTKDEVDLLSGFLIQIIQNLS